MNYLEVGKQLMKSKAMAKFSHYIAGNLYYKVVLEDGTYQFPIATVEEYYSRIDVYDEVLYELADDLGNTPFNAEMRGSELNRWIRKAIESEDFIKIG